MAIDVTTNLKIIGGRKINIVEETPTEKYKKTNYKNIT